MGSDDSSSCSSSDAPVGNQIRGENPELVPSFFIGDQFSEASVQTDMGLMDMRVFSINVAEVGVQCGVGVAEMGTQCEQKVNEQVADDVQACPPVVEKIGSAPPPLAAEQVAVSRQTCMTVVEEIDSAPPSFAAGDSVIIKTGEYEGAVCKVVESGPVLHLRSPQGWVRQYGTPEYLSVPAEHVVRSRDPQPQSGRRGRNRKKPTD